MHIGQALDLVSRYDSLRNPLTSLGITSTRTHLSLPCQSGTVTLRKRRLPLEMMSGVLLAWRLSVKNLFTRL
ncbi:IS4 ORF [Shigella sonnei]|uniref:hypothetical protein n=1 Tax=Shigella sonnei TaxID=624 RepID=UPI000DFF62D9|nr:IS4 ORF [Shigella sonnei]